MALTIGIFSILGLFALILVLCHRFGEFIQIDGHRIEVSYHFDEDAKRNCMDWRIMRMDHWKSATSVAMYVQGNHYAECRRLLIERMRDELKRLRGR